jgi:hypothetical protein
MYASLALILDIPVTVNFVATNRKKSIIPLVPLDGGPPVPIESLLFERTSIYYNDDYETEFNREEEYGIYGSDEEQSDMTQDRFHPPQDAVTKNDHSTTERPVTSVKAKKGTGLKKKVVLVDPPARERPADNKWPKREALSFTRMLVFYGAGSITEEHEVAARYIQEARVLRRKYLGRAGIKYAGDANVFQQNLEFAFGSDGVVGLFPSNQPPSSGDSHSPSLVTVPSIDAFVKDYDRLVEMVSEGAMRTFCFSRLQHLSVSFKMHTNANGAVESLAQSNLLGTDFYRTMKVDNHIHLAAAPSAKQFVSFVREKLRTEGDTVVLKEGTTLHQVFQDAGINTEHLTIDAFNVLADHSVYERFDNFNSKYSPFKLAKLRNIFLKVDNHIKGRYVEIFYSY